MSIAPLSLSTARILTASVALNDAVSVVKELVDNALDAAASTITIEISTNTIDIIQVKDNGRGIGIEDRQLLCKKGCTSKIRTIDDLNTLGGRSLGFRGEALASMANSSDAVIVTTKIEGEGVGTALKFGANGKIIRFVLSLQTSSILTDCPLALHRPHMLLGPPFVFRISCQMCQFANKP